MFLFFFFSFFLFFFFFLFSFFFFFFSFVFFLFSFFSFFFLFCFRQKSKRKRYSLLSISNNTFGLPCSFCHPYINSSKKKKKKKLPGWLIVGISQIVRESIPFLLALNQGDYFASERHTYHQLSTLPHRSKLCYSYAELVRAGIEPGTLWFLVICFIDWAKPYIVVKKSKVGGVAYCRYQPDSEGVCSLSTSARPGRLFCIWGGAPHLPSALHFTAQIQAVLLIRWVDKGQYQTRNLVVTSRMLYRLS